MLAVLGPEVGAGPSCRAIVIQDNVRLVPARKNHRADRSQEIMAVGVAHWQGRRWLGYCPAAGVVATRVV